MLAPTQHTDSIPAEDVRIRRLPDSWAMTAIGEVCLINPRFFTESVEEDQELTFLPMAAVEAGTGRINLGQTRHFVDVRRGYTRFSEGDVLFAKITPSMENGKVAVAKGLTNNCGCGSTEFHVLRPYKGVSGDFLSFFLLQNAFRSEAQRNMTGTAGQLRVPAGFLEEADFPFPPLNEQRRIVAEIEKQFTRLDASVASLKRVQANLKRYRESILKAACEGKLVPTEAEFARSEGRDYEPADQLLERILSERRAKWEAQKKRRGKYKEPVAPDTSDLPELPAGWVWATVEQIGRIGEQPVLTGPFGTNLKTADFTKTGIPVLTIGCLTTTGVSLDKAAFVSKEKAAELSRYALREGDLLFSRMATVGRAGLVEATIANCLFNYHIMRLRLAEGAILPRFFMEYIQGSSEVSRYVRKVNHGATRDGINTVQLLNLSVAMPPLAEQHRIVAEVERQLSFIRQAEAAVTANLTRAGRLRQSILKRAFSGKLVPQDPNDEPASDLLERIRAEREASLTAAKKSREANRRRAGRNAKGQAGSEEANS